MVSIENVSHENADSLETQRHRRDTRLKLRVEECQFVPETAFGLFETAAVIGLELKTVALKGASPRVDLTDETRS